MGCKNVYWCDICGRNFDFKDRFGLLGVDFSSMTKFKISTPDSTKGKHICLECLRQIIKTGSEYITTEKGE